VTSCFDNAASSAYDLLLYPQGLALACAGVPRPGVPLDADATQSIGLEFVADEVEARLPVADAGVCRQARPFLRGGQFLLAGEPVARPRKLFELRPRAQRGGRLPRGRNGCAEVGQRQRVGIGDPLSGER